MSEDYQRGQFDVKLEFLLVLLGYGVGYGNVWRFPYKALTYGGGAFLIPYGISLIVAGVPVYALELAIGQYASYGASRAFEHMAPIMHGIGWGSVVVSFLCSLNFNVIVAWSLYYFAVSFKGTLPWARCDHEWNTAGCSSPFDSDICPKGDDKNFSLFFNKTCYPLEKEDWINEERERLNKTSPADEYLHRQVLKDYLSPGFHDLGPLDEWMVLALAVGWVIIFLCTIKGIESTSKVAYFSATFPYVLIAILLFRALTLDGAMKGLEHFIIPKWKNLTSIEVWKGAAEQIFYTYGVAFGVVITTSSYNRFKNNVFTDALMLCLADSLTSIFVGLAVFSVLGVMAHDIGETNLDNIIKKEIGFAFVAFPEALARMPGSNVWSVIFFFMMILVGIDSQFAMVECVSTAVTDQWPRLRRWKCLVIAANCFISFLLGLPFCLQGGLYLFTLFNNHAAGWCLLPISLAELLTVMYIYGFRRFWGDIQMMTGLGKSRLERLYLKLWFACWMVITPAVLFTICVLFFVNYERTKLGPYEFPWKVEAIGFFLGSLSLSCIPIFALARILIKKIQGKPIKDLFKPTADWCPRHLRESPEPNRPLPMVPMVVNANQNLTVAYIAPNARHNPVQNDHSMYI